MASAVSCLPSYSPDQDPMSSLNTLNPNIPGTSPPLRRALYIRIIELADLCKINVRKMKEELVKAKGTPPPLEGEEIDTAAITPATAAKESGRTKSGGKTYQKRLASANGGVNLCLLVGKVDIVVDKVRVDKSRVRLAEVQVGDDTGSISLRARDTQIDMLQEVSNKNGAIVLRNCSLELYQGKHLRLAVTKWGKLSAYPDDIASTPIPPKAINHELNFSLVDINVVTEEAPESSDDFNSQKASPASSDGSYGKWKQPQSNQGHPQHFRGNRGHSDKRYHRLNHGGGMIVSSASQDSGYSQMPMNPNMMGGINSFSSIYPPSHFGYDQPQISNAPTQQHMRQPLSNNLLEQRQQMLQQYELQQRQYEQQQLQLYQQERHRQMQLMSQGGGQQSSMAAGMSPQPMMGNMDSNEFQQLGGNFLLTPSMESQLTAGQYSGEYQQSSTIRPENDDGASLDQRSSMNMEIPLSPPMNPQAATFAPTFSHDLMQHQYYQLPPSFNTFPQYSSGPYDQKGNVSTSTGKESENDNVPSGSSFQ